MVYQEKKGRPKKIQIDIVTTKLVRRKANLKMIQRDIATNLLINVLLFVFYLLS